MTARLATNEIDALADQIAEMAVHIDAATHSLLEKIRGFDHSQGWARQGAQSCAHWLSWRIGMGLSAAHEHVRVANRIGELPAIDAAFKAGSISYSKVRAITRVATERTEAELVTLARHSTGAQLEVACRKYRSIQRQDPKTETDRRYVQRRDLDDGMVKIDIALRADEAALVFTLLDKLAASARAESSAEDSGVPPYGDVKRLRPTKFDRADAFMAMVQTQVRGDAPDRSPIELIVVAGSTFPAETEDRLACDCAIVEVTEDAHGNAIDVGRKYRTVTTALKRALTARDPHCRFPGCANRLFLDAHHLVHWRAGGPTDLQNLARFCTFHHDLMHTGYSCTMVNGILDIRDPDDRRIAIVPDVPRPDRVGLATLHDRFTVDEAANRPLNPGRPTHHATIVRDLASCDNAELSGGRFDDLVDEWTLAARTDANLVEPILNDAERKRSTIAGHEIAAIAKQ